MDVKALYLLMYRQIPSVSFVSEIDGTKAFSHIKNVIGADVMKVLQHSYLDHDKKEMFFNNTIFVVKGERMIELANNYVHLLHTERQWKWARELAHALAENCRVETKKEEERRAIGFVRNSEMN